MSKWWLSAKADVKRAPQWVVAGLVILLGLGGAIGWALKPERHHIAVNGLDTPVTFTTTEKDLGAALRTQGITLNPKDIISPELTTALKGKKELAVTIKQAMPVSVLVDGNTIETDTQAATIADLLQELNITLGPKDGISADLQSPVEKGLSLKIVRRTQQTKVVREEIPFEVIREEDRDLMVGESRDVQEGINGIKEVTQVVYYEDGKEVAAEVTSEEIISSPQDQIVAYGTGGVVSRGGRSYRYTRELNLTATGYTAGKESNPDGNGYTYTGMKAVRGVVAVDPNVIPLYTRLYIEGYGPAIAGDIGGAIKGDRIDLCFDDLDEALEWGIRDVTVYILND